ncbi:MAG: DUF4235 domain-containing protein [Jatrophihabitantaceae bacterium]
MAVAIPVGRLVTKGTAKIWVTARPESPSVNPKDPDASWPDALIWAGLTGIGAAIAQLLTTKGADTIWRALTGRPSPRPKELEPIAEPIS